MDLITLTKDNIEKEHICCAIASNKDCQVTTKKAWLTERFKEGLVFKKKLPYIADGGYLKYKGFKVADDAAPHYELLYLPFEGNNTKPCFKRCAKEAKIKEKGFILYFSNQCPFTAKYVPIVKAIAEKGF